MIAYSVTSLADRLMVDFALIHKDATHPKIVAKQGSRSTLNQASAESLGMPDEAVDLDGGLTLIGDVSGRTAFIVVSTFTRTHAVLCVRYHISQHTIGRYHRFSLVLLGSGRAPHEEPSTAGIHHRHARYPQR